MFSTPNWSSKTMDNIEGNGEENIFDYQYLYNNSERDGNMTDGSDVEALMRSFSTPPLKRYTNSSNFGPATPSTATDSPQIQTPTLSSESDYSPHAIKSFSSVKRILHSNSIGSDWTIEMACLKQSTSLFEAVECLRRVRALLRNLDKSDRMKFCKFDYDSAVRSLRRIKTVWCDDLFKETVRVTQTFFNESLFSRIPRDVLLEIFQWMPINKFMPILSVCWEWWETGTSDEIWGIYYRRKFLMNNPGAMPSLAREDFITSFQMRLKDPQIGDKVEVAWKGKFRLETQDVYQGLAWWVAEVVDKHHSQGRYKIRYPGWDSRWDEWVPRSRLRWAVATNTLVTIHVNDIVELWCCGANVPGAWLESKVKKIRGDRYCLGKVLSSGSLWVERDRLRLVRSAAEQQVRDEQQSDLSRGRRRSSFFSTLMSYSFGGAENSTTDNTDAITPSQRASCTVM